MEWDRRAFRDALGHFPTGVVIVTAPAEGQEPVAMTVSSFNAVSLDPPLILFSIDRGAPSLPVLLRAPSFGISVLRREQKELSGRFSHGKGSKWEGIEPQLGASGCPLIKQCLAGFECEHFAAHEAGDHIIIVGRVLRFEIASEGEPLVFFRGAYHDIAAPQGQLAQGEQA
jgi:flavin reductase (DIM6/NTAB) family NADH-FMN oxidoreductase RutF